MPKYAEEILAAVTELQRHPTAEQVFLEMKKEHPSIAIGTVYKHLNALAEEGLLHRITESGSPDRYDRTERHDHLICSRCGKIADVHLPDIQSRIEHALGRDILSYDLKIRYICPDCREQEENNAEGGTRGTLTYRSCSTSRSTRSSTPPICIWILPTTTPPWA